MTLKVWNASGKTILIAFGYPSPEFSCDLTWAKKGWHRATSNQVINLVAGDVSNRTYFYYAETVDRTRFWSGEFFTDLPPQRFDWCWNTTSSDSRRLGLREIRTQFLRPDFLIKIV